MPPKSMRKKSKIGFFKTSRNVAVDEKHGVFVSLFQHDRRKSNKYYIKSSFCALRNECMMFLQGVWIKILRICFA